MTAVAPYLIRVRSPGMVPLGELGRISSMQLIPRFNAVGAFEITMSMADPKSALIARGGWLEFKTGDDALMAGHIRGIKEVHDANNVGGTLTVYGPSAEQLLSDRVAYQVPTSVASSQNTDDYDNRVGTAETIIKEYVDLNAGPNALVNRRTLNFVIEANQFRGGIIKGTARMTNLLDLCAGLATAAGLGFRVVFNTLGQLEFQMYQPVDNSGNAKFGMALGNLVSYERISEAAKTNCAIAGGGGEGTLRTYREINDTDAQTEWNHRSETFIDRRDSTDVVELDQAATEEITTNGPVNGLSIKTVDTPRLQFARDYYLGDTVSIPDAEITDVLREVDINWSVETGAQTESTVGTTSTTGTPGFSEELERLNARVAALETNL